MPDQQRTSSRLRPFNGQRVVFTPKSNAFAPRLGIYDRDEDCFREIDGGAGEPWRWHEVTTWTPIGD